MKKSFVFVVLFGSLAGSVSAQVMLRGNLYTGITADIPYDGEESIGLKNREKGNTVMDVSAAALLGEGAYGVKLDTTFSYLRPDITFTPKGMYGWTELFDRQIRLSLGKISDGVWVTSLDNDYTFDEIAGARVECRTPLEGLSVGMAFDAGDYTVENFAKQLIFGGSYVSAIFNIVGAYDFGSNTRALFGFNFTGIDDLTTAGIELRFTDIALWEQYGELAIDEEAAYRIIRPLTVSLHMAQKVYGKAGSDMGLAFRPGLAYKLTRTLTGSLEVEVNSDDVFKTSNLALTPCIEYQLPGSGILYLQYDLTLAALKEPSHAIGLGLEIKSF
jgi:hypothetical protein